MKGYFKSSIITYAVSIVLLIQAGSLRVSAEGKFTRWTPEMMISYKRVGGTAVSPDGKIVAYTVSTPLMEGEKSELLTHIRIVSSCGRQDRQLTFGEKSCHSPSFSPDGKYLAFRSTRGSDKKNQVWILNLNGGDAEQLTNAKSGVGASSWSPDGGRVAYTMKEPETDEEEKNRKEKRDMRVLDKNFKYSHLYTIRIDKDSNGKREIRRLTSGNFHITAFDWSADSKTIAFSHQINPSADEWSTSDIYSVPSDSGAVTTLVASPGADRYPRYSPDGKWLAFPSDMDDPNWALLSDVYLIPSGGGKPQKLAETPDRNFMYYGRFLGWSSDSREIYIIEADRTSWRVFAIPADGEKPRVITKGPGNFTNASFSRNGNVMAFIHQTIDTPPDVYITGTLKFEPVKLTGVNADIPMLPMGKTEAISWKSVDGLEIEGLLTYPVNYKEGKRYPLILVIHGGPAGTFSQGFTAAGSVYPIQAFAQEGYAVLRANPRGSSGYGKNFRFANRNDWGYGDFDDQMTGIDRVIELGVAHPDSLCVTGWSYGGYMTSMIVTKTKRFKAACMGAGISNLISFTGTADIPSFLPDYFSGEPWDRTETYMKHSAVFRVKGVSTPTLILHGELDRRVPISQGYEFYNALRRQGCPTEMVVYPRTPHGLREPKFIVDAGERIIAWFDAHLRRSK
jgi:dipeptidyl aminopeptidase/acylaminoacyl peptidase